MTLANQFKQPINYYGQYKTNSWAGYVFKEILGYTSGRHTGVDYNGAGGGNADLGMEIGAVANGIVRYVGNKTSIGFGNVTIIEHQLSPTLKKELGCDSLFSRIMHQNSIDVVVGQVVSIGQRIGSVGNTGTQWAHDHTDLYKSTIEGGGVHFRYDKDTQLASYLDTFEFIQAHLTAVDLEPTQAAALGYQRIVENSTGVNERLDPSTKNAPSREFAKGETLDFKGYVHGESISGNDIWFVGRYAGRYFWSGAFVDKGTHDLADLTPAPSPVPPPTPSNPTPEKVYTFEKDFDFVTAVKPAAITNFEYGNFPSAPTKAVVHDFGTKGVDTLQSTTNAFQKKTSVESEQKSAHFGVSGKNIYQYVKLGDRAYHAGPQGNVYVGIETDPNQDADTIASVRKLLEALRDKYGYVLEPIKHSSIMATQCGDDVDLKNYIINPITPPTKPEEPSDLDKENNGILKQILEIVKAILAKLNFIK